MRKEHEEIIKRISKRVRISRFNDFEPDEEHSWKNAAGIFKTPFKFSAEKLLSGEEDFIIDDECKKL